MPRCKFKNNGKPTTMPGTDDDQKRIALSGWITAMLVFNGDEAQGDYQVLGATGYAAWQVKEAKQRLAPQKPATRNHKQKVGYAAPMGERVKPRKEPPPEPPNERTLLAARLRDFARQLGKLKTQIDFLTKPD